MPTIGGRQNFAPFFEILLCVPTVFDFVVVSAWYCLVILNENDIFQWTRSTY